MTQLDLPLGYKKQPNPSARPSDRSPELIHEAVRRQMKNIMCWMGGMGAITEKEYDSVLADVVDAMDACFCDAEGMIEYLIRYRFWDMDESEDSDDYSNLLDVLDRIHTYDLHQEAVKKWVRANMIDLSFQVGDSVSCGDRSGTITRLHPETAQYTIHCTNGRQYLFDAEQVSLSNTSGDQSQAASEIPA